MLFVSADDYDKQVCLAKLRSIEGELIDSCVDTASLVDRLVAKNIISSIDKHNLDQCESQPDKCRKLIKCVYSSRRSNAFIELVSSLQEIRQFELCVRKMNQTS